MVRSAKLLLLALLLVPSSCDRGEQQEAPSPDPESAPVTEPALNFPDSDGRVHTPFAADDRKATVLIFLMNDCPVANASAPALARVCVDFESRGVVFYGIYTTETAEEITTHRRDYRLPFPGLLDPDLELAKLAGATRVPEAAVFAPSGALLYRGRIDDRAVSLGVVRPQPRREDLRLALEATLAGETPDPQFTTSVGCYLPFPLEERP